jgi:hypothetical protein
MLPTPRGLCRDLVGACSSATGCEAFGSAVPGMPSCLGFFSRSRLSSCEAPAAAMTLIDDGKLVGWLTLLVAVCGVGAAIWYAWLTRGLWQEAARQTELQIGPFVVLRYVREDDRIFVANIGQGIARNIKVANTYLGGEGGETDYVERWLAIDYIRPGDERRLHSFYSFYACGGEIPSQDQRDPEIAKFIKGGGVRRLRIPPSLFQPGWRSVRDPHSTTRGIGHGVGAWKDLTWPSRSPSPWSSRGSEGPRRAFYVAYTLLGGWLDVGCPGSFVGLPQSHCLSNFV